MGDRVGRGALLLGSAALLGGCGPTPREIGVAVLSALPMVLVIVLALQAGLLWLWRRAQPTLTARWRPMGPIVITASAVAAAALLWGGSGAKLAIIALWYAGSSYLAAVLLVMRLWRAHGRTATLVVGPHVVALALFALPAVALTFVSGAHESLGHLAENFYIYPGFGGFVPGAIAVVLVVEALLAARRARQTRP